MSIRMFKPLAIICLPALLFTLTYTISLYASNSQGNGKRCKGTIRYGETGYTYVQGQGVVEKTCSDMDADECADGAFHTHAYSNMECYDSGIATDYCKEKETDPVPEADVGNCYYDGTNCGLPSDVQTKSLTYC